VISVFEPSTYTTLFRSLMSSLRQSGQVRLLSSITARARSGSIHSEPPVYPKCPKLLGEKELPACDGGAGVSHPRAREVPGGEVRSEEHTSELQSPDHLV